MNRALGWLLVLTVGLPILLLAVVAQQFTRIIKRLHREPSCMGSEPFDGHPPQGVVYECRNPGCDLHQENTVEQFSEVKQRVKYYCQQGHQAIARFPAADDAEWPPDEPCRDE